MNARRLMLLAYTCSGVAGLVYQVTWTRLLVLHVGSTTGAITTVIAAFMGGLALGAGAAAAIAPRIGPKRAFRVYAALEAGAAAAAFLLPFALSAAQPLLAWAYRADGTGLGFTITRTAICLAAVAVPCLLLGATFPVAMRSVSGSGAPPTYAGWLYAVNTAGAAAGALAAGFLLLPRLGLRRTTLAGAGASLLAAACALLAGRFLKEPGMEQPLPAANRSRAPSRKETPVAAAMTASDMWGAALMVGITGFAGLLYEVAWTRAVASLLGPTTYAFAGVVFVLIAGLALGGAIGSSRWMRRLPAHATLGVALALAALIAWWGDVGLGTRVPETLARTFAGTSDAGWPLLLQMASTLLPLLPVALGLGVSFPIALRLAGADESASRRIGFLYAINTAAGVAGALLSATLLVSLGLESALRIVPAALLAAAALAMALATRFRDLVPTLAAAGMLGIAVYSMVIPLSWDRALLASGIYKYARTIPPGVDLDSVLKAATLVDYRDGEHATIAVTKFAGTTSLVVDGKVDGSSSGDMLTQELVAHLPLLLHPHPNNVLVIGLGTGVTLASAATHPAQHIDVVEISPEIVRASAYFREQNRDVLKDPRVHLIVGDGRSQLRLSSGLYDVIISEPSNPWVAGMAALFTRETFESIRDRLAPGGTACQWVHTYDISEADLRSIVATFASVFPHSALWMVGDGDLLMTASKEPIEPLLANVASSWNRPGVAADLARVGVMGPFGVLSLWAGGIETLAALGNAPLQTDDRMALEFSGPAAVYSTTGSNQVRLVRHLRDSAERPAVIQDALANASPSDWRNRGAMLQRIHVYDDAYADYVRAFTMNPGDADTVSGLAALSIQARTTEDAIGRLHTRLKTAPNSVPARIALSKLLATVGRRDEAIAVVQTSTSDEAMDVPLVEQLAALYADAGDLINLERTVERLQAVRPNAPKTRYYSASARFMQGAFTDSLAQVKFALTADPKDADALNLAGDALASLGRFDEAQQMFESALTSAPEDATIYTNLGLVAMGRKDPRAAEKRFAAALTLNPSLTTARDGLSRAKSALAR